LPGSRDGAGGNLCAIQGLFVVIPQEPIFL